MGSAGGDTLLAVDDEMQNKKDVVVAKISCCTFDTRANAAAFHAATAGPYEGETMFCVLKSIYRHL